jgi:hypothetical protein
MSLIFIRVALTSKKKHGAKLNLILQNVIIVDPGKYGSRGGIVRLE